MLPNLKVGDAISLERIEAIERFTKPKARYTEASLVKKLEELGIGRPSTYASTITTIQNRGYVDKGRSEGSDRKFNFIEYNNGKLFDNIKIEKTGADKSKLIPSDIGMVVTDFLIDNFEQVMDYSFTADVEKEFDQISRGEKKWNEMIKQFYNVFHKRVNEVSENSEKAKGERLLGKDPKTGENVYVKIGRYGPFIQIGEGSRKTKQNVRIPKDVDPKKLTRQMCLDLRDKSKK